MAVRSVINRPQGLRESSGETSAGYAAPALEKGLDILELLAASPATGLTQKQIADRLNRRPSEIFRMLVVLHRRGYVRRQTPADTYHLTARLFELSHRHPPVQHLLETAIPLMREVATAARQSCHLAVREGEDALTLAKIDSPDARGLSVRVGVRFPLETTASGRVLLAFGDPPGDESSLDLIRRRGFERRRSGTHRGVIDLSCPVLDYRGVALAAMTIPYLTRRGEQRSEVDKALAVLKEAAATASQSLGGAPPPFS